MSLARHAGPPIDSRQAVAFEPEAGFLAVLAGPVQIDKSTGVAVLASEKPGDQGGPLPTGDKFYLNRRPGVVRSGGKRSI